MKKQLILIFIAFLSISNAFAQTQKLPIDTSTGKFSYSETVYVDSLTKHELFSTAIEWFAKTYNTSPNVIVMADKKSGEITGIECPSGYINYTMSIYVKDGSYKYEITDFHHNCQYNNTCEQIITPDKIVGISYQTTYDYYLNQMNSNIRSLIVDLKTSMDTKCK